MKKKNAFTLIELIVVLVILAIVALIVTPLVLNIIDKAKDSANKRSIDDYGKALELAMSLYKLEHGKFTYDVNDLNIEYSGNKVECDEVALNENGSVFITKCKIDGEYVEDSKTSDGYYQYGEIIPDYAIGDIVTYNSIKFYVINNSNKSIDYVTLLKAEPLTVDEVNTYGMGKINLYSHLSIGQAYQSGGYGSMQYYSTSHCGYVNDSLINDGCTTDYNVSDVKYVVDNWAKNVLNDSDLGEDELGYKSRLITYDELKENLEYTYFDSYKEVPIIATEKYSDWLNNGIYGDWYWTMTQYYDYSNQLWMVSNGHLIPAIVGQQGGAVRPVINLKKSAIEQE